MNDIKKVRHTKQGIELLSLLSEAGFKIFRTSDAKRFSREVGIADKSLSTVLYLLKEEGWILSLRKGLFALSRGFSTDPIHEFEIAMALTHPVALSHWTALNFHGLSDQIPRKVFLLITEESTVPRQKGVPYGSCLVNGVEYVFTRVIKEHFFGLATTWISRTKVSITDPERTLVDGLDKPQLCGGFDEVLHAFQLHKNKIDLEKICSYALQIDTSTVKRLGWVLSKLNFEKKRLTKLFEIEVKGYRKLDSSGPDKGHYNSTWMIRENIYG